MQRYLPFSDFELDEDGLPETSDVSSAWNVWADTVQQIITTKPTDALLEAYQEDMFD